MPRQQIRRLVYQNETYVAYRDIIDALKEMLEEKVTLRYLDGNQESIALNDFIIKANLLNNQ